MFEPIAPRSACCQKRAELEAIYDAIDAARPKETVTHIEASK